MSKENKFAHIYTNKQSHKIHQSTVQASQRSISPFDLMEDGVEYESLIKHKAAVPNLRLELERGFSEITAIRKRPLISYMANVINSGLRTSRAIERIDDLPFAEMINSVDPLAKSIDVLLVTPGGAAQQVASFVDKLRTRFDEVSFIIPNLAMSAGTIFCMSGDEVIMTSDGLLGPTDPQMPGKDGNLYPAQAVLTLIEDIRIRGEELIAKGQRPSWTDLAILQNINAKEIGHAKNASKFSIDLVREYLKLYKFKSWTNHSDGKPVTDLDKEETADRISKMLCDHGQWNSHSNGINRDVLRKVCGIKITHPETIEGLDRAIKRNWAFLSYIMGNPFTKIFFASGNKYCIIRSEAPQLPQQNK